MDYVIQVAPGTEDKTEMLIRGKVKANTYTRCFHPVRHMRKKFHGEWRDLYEKLLPGYVFIISQSIRELYGELRRVPALTKLLGKEGDLFISLAEYEIEWLEQIVSLRRNEPRTDADCAEVGLSQVMVTEENRVMVLSGPLKGIEGRIRKMNLHKRVAEVEVDFMGRKMIVYLGIEIVRTRTIEN